MRSQTIYSTITILILTLSVAIFAVSCSSLNLIEETSEPEIEWYFDQIFFEIAAVQSATPSQAALDRFRESLHENRFCPRDQITFRVHAISYPPPPSFWNGSLIAAFEGTLRRFRDLDPDDRKFTVFIAYVDGIWFENGVIRLLGGLQYGESSFAIFKSGAGDRESGVLLHEFSHMIGMVWATSATYDETHLRHCADEDCVMYWTTPEGDTTGFCDLCRREVQRKIHERNTKQSDK